jgi:hypothetical protein
VVEADRTATNLRHFEHSDDAVYFFDKSAMNEILAELGTATRRAPSAEMDDADFERIRERVRAEVDARRLRA